MRTKEWKERRREEGGRGEEQKVVEESREDKRGRMEGGRKEEGMLMSWLSSNFFFSCLLLEAKNNLGQSHKNLFLLVCQNFDSKSSVKYETYTTSLYSGLPQF